jgi:SAM-dependent methyltransferase/uncharacterized membrane protein YbhN (UPF0104 family)
MQQSDNKSATHPQQIAILATFVIGIVVTLWWITNVGLQAVGSEIIPLLAKTALPTLIFTALAIVLRFLRWHFLLRVWHIKIPIRESLIIFLSGLVMIVTPLYVGEITKAFLLQNRYGAKLRETSALVILERLWDVAAVLFLFAITSPVAPPQLTFLGVIVIILVGTRWIVSRRIVSPTLARFLYPAPLLICFLSSLLSWTFASATLFAVAESNLNIIQSLQIYSSSTLLGALSLVPAGLGVTGSALIYQLQEAGLPTQKAVAAVIVLRSLTVWASVIVGSISLYYGVRYWGWFRKLSSINHFDDIADEYEETIPHHIRSRLLDRKLAPIIHELQNNDRAAMIGLDLGSGQGWYLQKMLGDGFKMVGVDAAWGQLAAASRSIRANQLTPNLSVSNALSLPFASESFDFIYCINVMHHIEDRDDQSRAFDEIARLLKPRGYFFLHEINVTNPVFRIYMGYIFPLIKIIDTGAEEWLLPHELADVKSLSLRQTHYFTFLPDFTPKVIYKFLIGLESWLEQSAWRIYSAHYMSVFNKPPNSPADAAIRISAAQPPTPA